MAHRRRLQVEPLEDRRMLAVFTVSNLLDGPVVAAEQLPGSLRQAIFDANAAEGADDIEFSVNGTIAIGSQLPTITEGLTITGPGANLLTINAGNGMNGLFGDRDGWRIFKMDDADDDNLIGVAMSGLTLTGGDMSFGDSYNGGGAIVNRENLTITNCTISGNSATGDGGAIYTGHGTATITDCTISGNMAYFGGAGGILNYNGALAVTNSTISNNSANGYGGGINNVVGTATITDCTISGNTAAGSGGGISNSTYGSLSIINSTIAENSADSGGGIWNRNATATVTGSTISGNSATGSDFFANSGGGIFNDIGTLDIADSTITDNSAVGSGGGIFNDDSMATVTGSTISANTATEFGGGIFSRGNGSLNLANSTISGNSVNFDGGGISIRYSYGAATVTNSTISGNSATYSGGGIHLRYGTATVSGSTISGNSGGGIYIYGTAMLDNTIVANSMSGGDISGSANGSYNLIEDGSGGPGLLNTISGDPLLGPLQNNDGPTLTHALLAGSPAIDMGDPGFASPPDYDQRGVGFDRVVNGRIDIGAFEVQAVAPPSADYDGDGDVDGRDFLLWQRGGSPTPFSGDDLELWQEEYGEEEEIAEVGVRSAESRERETASDDETVFENLYIEAVDRALEELATVPRYGVREFGEMVARRGGVKRGASAVIPAQSLPLAEAGA